MKKRILALLLLLSLLFTACAAPAQPTAPTGCTAHTDADDNGVCDVCLSYVLVVVDFYNINDLHGKIDDTDKQPGVDELTTYFKRMQKKRRARHPAFHRRYVARKLGIKPHCRQSCNGLDE